MTPIRRLGRVISPGDHAAKERYCVSVTFSFSGRGFQDLRAAAEQVKKNMIDSFESMHALKFDSLRYLICPAENEDGDED
jgi:hypothetical protein